MKQSTITRWAFLLAGLTCANAAYRSVQANEPYLAVFAISIGFLAVYGWNELRHIDRRNVRSSLSTNTD